VHAASIDVVPVTFRSTVICAVVRRLVKQSTQVLAVLVILQLRCCPAVIVPAQSPAVVLVKKLPAGTVSVTLNGPEPNVTSIPVDEPTKMNLRS